MVALAVTAGIGFAAEPTQALSFSIPAGRTIVDLDFSGTTGDFVINGGANPETLSLTAGVNVIRLDDGTDIGLAAGQVTLALDLTLDAGSLETSSGVFDTTVTADFRSAACGNLTLFDNDAGELALAADVAGPTQLTLTEGFTGVTGTFGGASQGGGFVVSTVNSELVDHVLPAGNLAGGLSVFRQNGSTVLTLAPLLDGGDPQGFEDFDAQPGGDLNFVPEPGAACLLGLCLVALAARPRSRQLV